MEFLHLVTRELDLRIPKVKRQTRLDFEMREEGSGLRDLLPDLREVGAAMALAVDRGFKNQAVDAGAQLP